ncbi:MAG TPA: class I SAM-dependent methyltransferase [Bacteroidales bacterium]|nr:class I SAM-dependent methyltransferase [Bacteroidales bacterium]
MMQTVNKRHWYDGFIYDRLLAPNQKGSFERISELIPENSDVLDIGCGTGRLAFRLAEKCRSVTAIDLSETNIRTAERTKKENSTDNINFIHTSLSAFLLLHPKHFDYAVLSYILHEVSDEERSQILREASSVSDKIIVSDHKPDTIPSARIVREVMEFFAGKDHYSSYRSYIRNNGISDLTGKAGLRIIRQETFRSHLQISVLQKVLRV